ncbi:unnamed protein product [Euphydryas editha]|uniref:Uncharacterized protein n=1 Tax=Euphydryas editha TaxID=104508 RepID=A0AAU9VEZ0_EUPED|nr:unnamed protein product [Euphydryas editha]
MESIKDSLSAMADMFNAKTGEFQKELQKSTSPVTAVSLSAEFIHLKMFIMTKLTTPQRQVKFLEMRKRRKMILLHGIEEDKSKDTTARVTSLVAC